MNDLQSFTAVFNVTAINIHDKNVDYDSGNPIRNFLKKLNKQPVRKQTNDKYVSFIDLIRNYCGSIENKTVLEIGSDWNGELLLLNLRNAK